MKKISTRIVCVILRVAYNAGFFVAVASSAVDSWLPAQATVVIVVGLPGDVESEKTYRDQLSALNELLPQKVLILVDPSREKFLAMSKSLAGETNPVLVVVWGHGGLQGEKPVFHVTGPRLTTSDFKTVADQLPSRDTRWLLFFRGSGAFARELAGPGRLIIASEKETIFNSDPVGMALLLKLLRDNPTQTFESLAHALGQATTDWYEQRGLVRTEEPTLWRGTESTELLASALGAETLTSEKPRPRLTSAWNEIAKVDAREYPDADGVVLRRRIEYTLGNSPALSADHEEFIQVLTAEGKRFGDFDIAYWPPQEDIKFLNCEVQSADGTLTRLDPDAVREGGEQAVEDYRTARRKFFSLPGITPGAVLHVRYQSTWQTFPLPHVTLSIPVASELSIKELAVQVTVPRDSAFHFAFDQMRTRDPKIKQTTYGSSYSWRFERIPAHVHEVLSPPRRAAALLVSTFPDWGEFARWYERISRLSGEVTQEISSKAEALVRDAKSDRDKVRALYHYVANLRYVAVPLGVNSFRPHAAVNVLNNNFGDCKDKANLFNTLLRSQGIRADLVLVPRFSQAHEAVPGFAFNHAISRVSLSNETIWVDTTDDTCPFDMLPPGDAGRNVLVVDGATKTLTQLPVPRIEAHTSKLRAQIESSDGWPVKLDVTTTGFCDYELRAAARLLGEMKSTQPLLAMTMRPVFGAFAMTKQTFTPVSSIEEDFAWHAEGGWTGYNAPFWLPGEWYSALHARTGPLFLNQGYPLKLIETVEGLPVTKTKMIENTQAPLKWKLEHQTLIVELLSGEIPVEEVPVFQRQLRALLTALADRADFR